MTEWLNKLHKRTQFCDKFYNIWSMLQIYVTYWSTKITYLKRINLSINLNLKLIFLFMEDSI